MDENRIEELQKENESLRKKNEELSAKIDWMRDKMIDAQMRVRRLNWLLREYAQESEQEGEQ